MKKELYLLLYYTFMIQHTGLGKLPTCVRDILETIKFTNCGTSLFFNNYVHDHDFLIY